MENRHLIVRHAFKLPFYLSGNRYSIVRNDERLVTTVEIYVGDYNGSGLSLFMINRDHIELESGYITDRWLTWGSGNMNKIKGILQRIQADHEAAEEVRKAAEAALIEYYPEEAVATA